jgi:hypothetical protein
VTPPTVAAVKSVAPQLLESTVNYVDVLNEQAAQTRNVLQENPRTQAEFLDQVRSDAQFILDNPGFIRSNQPVVEVRDAQGNVTSTREQIIERLRIEAESVVRAPENYGIRNAVSSETIAPSTVEPAILVTPSVGQASLPLVVVQAPIAPVTIQASQNPTADFATTRSFSRNTVPEQLNRGVADSPLSSSRIFPGMR